jgi:hypothetical protein
MEGTIEIKFVKNQPGDDDKVTIKKWQDSFPNNLVTGKYIDKDNTEIQIHLDKPESQALKPGVHFFNAFLRNCPV